MRNLFQITKPNFEGPWVSGSGSSMKGGNWITCSVSRTISTAEWLFRPPATRRNQTNCSIHLWFLGPQGKAIGACFKLLQNFCVRTYRNHGVHENESVNILVATIYLGSVWPLVARFLV